MVGPCFLDFHVSFGRGVSFGDQLKRCAVHILLFLTDAKKWNILFFSFQTNDTFVKGTAPQKKKKSKTELFKVLIILLSVVILKDTKLAWLKALKYMVLSKTTAVGYPAATRIVKSSPKRVVLSSKRLNNILCLPRNIKTELGFCEEGL